MDSYSEKYAEVIDMYKEIIETKDLILKKASMDDVNDMHYNLWSHQESAKHMLWIPTKNFEEAKEKMIRTIELQKGKMEYLVYIKRSGKAIGFAGMMEIEDKIYKDSGIAIGPKFVGRGYGKQILMAMVEYCFESLGAVKIVSSCRSENIASRNLLLSCGLHYTHSQPKVDKRDGFHYVLDFYELIRNE